MKSHALATLGLLGAATVAAAAAPASAPYTNANLKGCYAIHSESQDPNIIRNAVGTICFNGSGGVNASPSGRVANTNGTVTVSKKPGGSYSVTNEPGWGMGTITEPCSKSVFV